MTDASPAVKITGLTVRFGQFTAVDGLSFSVARGEIFGFLGANGAGKTTAIRVMCGLLEPSAGHVEIAGRDFSDGGNAIKSIAGYMSQKFTLYDDMTADENLAFKAGIRKIPDAIWKTRAKELLSFAGFDYSRKILVKDLPSGVKQQLSLAAALLHDPEIIFLDEPTAGVSPVVRSKFWQLIRQLAAGGKTVIVTTHYMDEAENCGRIALMRAGRLIALDSPANLKMSVFPEPLAAISSLSGEKPDITRIMENPAIISLTPYGLKYHAVMKDESAFEEFIKNVPAGITVNRISPSLEDVFIRLVEGKER